MEITDLLLLTQKNKASDLHLSTGNPPILRLHGDMMPYQNASLTADAIKHMLYAIMTEQQRAEYERELEIDFAISFGEDMRFRVNAFNNINGPAAVLRTIPSRIQSLDELGAPEILKSLCDLHKGLILVTGPTGSGKSTTLAAMVDHINANQSRHILTVEDPVEFIHTSKKSLINQREVGRHTHSFARALKSSLREDPDVILVGEMRDLETIRLALTAAETGHLVMGTLHTNSAPETVDRVIDVFPADDKEMVRSMLSVALQAVITQTLIKHKEGGRVAAHEIMISTPAVRNLIREARIPQLYSLIKLGSKAGMVTMKDSIYALLDSGAISEQTARVALFAGIKEDAEEEEARNNPQGTRRPVFGGNSKNSGF
jgi:twitching motility protein PilT